MKRKIIRIDEATCNGCGKCASACAEGAIAMVDGKARLVSDVHNELLAGRVLLVGCPKLDDTDFYIKKLTSLFEANNIRSVDVATMEVPCCHGLVQVVRQAIAASGKAIPLSLVQVSIQGVIRERVEAPPPAAGPEFV